MNIHTVNITKQELAKAAYRLSQASLTGIEDGQLEYLLGMDGNAVLIKVGDQEINLTQKELTSLARGIRNGENLNQLEFSNKVSQDYWNGHI